MGKGAVDVVVESSSSPFVPFSNRLVETDTNLPSSHYEGLAVQHLRGLLDASKVSLRASVKMGQIALRAVVFHQGVPVALTFGMLLVSCVAMPVAQTIACTLFFAVLYAICMAVQVYLLWARITEKKQNTAAVMGEVLDNWERRITAMMEMRRQSHQERWAVFRSTFAVIPAKAFRMVAAVEKSTWRLKYVLKSLLIKRARRLDEATLRVWRYMEPVGLCKLIDVMRMTLESCAIVLRPLQDRARPPRHPNLHIASGMNTALAEEADTTDESDHDHDERLNPNTSYTSSVPQQMEFLVHRIFLLLWVLGIIVTVTAGVVFYYEIEAPLEEGVFLYPAVALLGMLPVNAILLHRVLLLYANIYLDTLFQHLVSKPTHALDDRIPRFSFWSIMKTLRGILFRKPQDLSGKNPLCFSSSIVESLGMVTVVALLDASGVVTDMVPLPTLILMLKENDQPESSSSSDDEGAGAGGEDAARDMDDAAREQRREMRRHVRRKKFQERRFLEVRLSPSLQEDLAVEFADEKEREERQQNLNPVALCLLLHALVPEPTNLETWTEPFRFCDRTLAWARSAHWIPRAAGFDDSIAASFRLLARVFQIDTKSRTGYHRDYPEQACTLLVEGDDGALHAFTVGTVYMVTRSCPFHWTGASIAELDVEAREELVHVGKMQWEEGAGLEVVAASHQLLPESFQSCVKLLPHDGPNYAEFFFFNGVQATADSNGLTARRSGRNGVTSGNCSHACKMDTERGNSTETATSHIYTNNPLDSNNKSDENYSERTYGVDSYHDNDNHTESSKKDGNSTHNDDTYSNSSYVGVALTPAKSESDILEGDTSAQDGAPVTLDELLSHLVGSSHTFLGLVGLRDSLRTQVQNSVALLEEAGIRCMFFCAENERRTKSLGSRLGLETDWNCCIALKEGAVELDHHSIRAQLPVGIKSIRKHILHVDPIPLQVNMFSHAHSVSTRAMLSILQDNHEVVLAIGSLFNHGNVRSFIQADLAIGVLPTRRGPVAEKELTLGHSRVVEPSDFNAESTINRDLSLYRNVADLIRCACSLSAAPTPSILPIVTTLIRQARMRLSGIGNCVEFTMHANFFITMINVVAILTGAPLLISPTATIFELNLIVPILALSCTYTAYAGMDSMKTISSRHNYFVRLAILRHSALVWGMRYIPSLVTLLVLGLTCGARQCGVSVAMLALSSTNKCITSTRGYIVLTLNYWLMIHSWTHMSRHYPLSPDLSFKTRYGKRSTYLFRSFRWVSALLLTTFLSILFVLLDTLKDGVTADAFYPSLVHFLASLVFPIVILLLDVPIKSWRLRRFNLMQKFRRLSFGTRLGMHSPRGDYEPEGVTFTNNSNNESDRTRDRTPTMRQRLHEVFYRFATMRRGKLELNCVCCDHIGGNYASYHVTANNM